MPGKNADASVGSLTSAWQYCIASCALAIWAPELTLWMSNTVGSPVSTVRQVALTAGVVAGTWVSFAMLPLTSSKTRMPISEAGGRSTGVGAIGAGTE